MSAGPFPHFQSNEEKNIKASWHIPPSGEMMIAKRKMCVRRHLIVINTLQLKRDTLHFDSQSILSIALTKHALTSKESNLNRNSSRFKGAVGEEKEKGPFLVSIFKGLTK